MTAEEYVALIDAHGRHVRADRDGWYCECGAHESTSRESLHVTDAADRVLVHCFAGCSIDSVLAADGLTARDLWHDHRDNGGARPTVVETYPYVDATGELLYEVVRFDPKGFRQRRPDGAGGHVWNLHGTRRVLYRLPAVIEAAAAGGTVYVVEGERDVHALEQAGMVATTCPGGAGKWRVEYTEVLRGADVVIVADRDDPGRKHAAQVAAALHDVAASLRVVEPIEGKDAADHLRAGRSVDELAAVGAGASAAPAIGGDVAGLLVDMKEAMLHAHDPIPHLIEPIAVRGLVTVLVGRHSSMKSWLMICTGAAVQANDCAVIAGYTVAHAPVLYIDAEMGPRLMARRFAAAGLAHDAFHVADGFRLRLPQSKAQITALIQATGAQLVVMDSLRRLAPGAREDKSDDMSPIMACLAELSRELDVAVVLIHHRSTKDGAAETRGSSAIEDQADIVLAFERVNDDPHRSRRRLRTIKYRPDEEPPATWVSVGYCGPVFTIDEVEGFDGADSDPRPVVLVADAEKLAAQIAEDGGWPPSRLAEALGVSRSSGTYTRTWKALQAAGWHASGASSARLLHPPGTSPYAPLAPPATPLREVGGASSSTAPDSPSQSQIPDVAPEPRKQGGASGGASPDFDGEWQPYESSGGFEEPEDQWWQR